MHLSHSFTNSTTICAIRNAETCLLHEKGVPYQCSLLNVDTCGCIEASIMSNVIFIIDNTGFTNDYSWYYWAVEWIKIYQSKILNQQPFIQQNVTYIHIADHASKYKVTSNYNQQTESQIIPNTIWNSWTIPPILQNNSAPNFCIAMDFALQHTTPNDIDNTIFIYLANLTPLFPNSMSSCKDIGYNMTVNTLEIPLYIIRSSPNVNISFINDEFKISLLSTMINQYNNDTDDWGSIYNESQNVYSPNHEVIPQYLDRIVSSAADFVCENAYLCHYSVYSTVPNGGKCKFTCNTMDSRCLTNITGSKYYVVNSFSGTGSAEMSQIEANRQCLNIFGTNLGSMKQENDTRKIVNLMNYMNVNECWIGINDTIPIFSVNDIKYYQWIDGNINSFPNFTNNEQPLAANHCISISKDGLKLNECNQAALSCSVCNVEDDAVLTVQDSRHYLIYSDSQSLSWQQADTFCVDQFGTHLSTIQMQTDLESITDLSIHMMSVMFEAELIDLSDDSDEYHIWSGQKILISYDECIDFWTRKFDIIYADGSHLVFNNSLIDLESIIIETCSPTAAPTNAPSQSPTNSPTFSPTLAPTQSPSASPTNSPTTSPTNAPTESPTKAPTTSPTQSPTKAPTKPPTKSPTHAPTDSPLHLALPTPSPTISICAVGFDLDLIFLIDDSCGLTHQECDLQMNEAAELIGSLKADPSNPKFGLIQYTDSNGPVTRISLSDTTYNSNDQQNPIHAALVNYVSSLSCGSTPVNTNLVAGINAAKAEFLNSQYRGSSITQTQRKLVIFSNCADKTSVTSQPTDQMVCEQFGYSNIKMSSGQDIQVTVVNAKSSNSDIPDIDSYLRCMVPNEPSTGKFNTVNDASNADDWDGIASQIIVGGRRRRLGLCGDNAPWVVPTPSPIFIPLFPTPPPTHPEEIAFPTEAASPSYAPTMKEGLPDPFLPTSSPLPIGYENPLEPSPHPSLSPTPSPVYISDQCVTLVVKLNTNNTATLSSLNDTENEFEYELNWITHDCDSTFLSMWSCNVIDRAKYQRNSDQYTLLMDDMETSWIDANNYCHQVFDTSLATVYNEQDHSDIVSLKNNIKEEYDVEFDNKRDESIWIGMRLDNGNFAQSKLSWSDKSVSNYSNLVSGCLAIDGINESMWRLQVCAEYRNHYSWSCNSFIPTQYPTLFPTEYPETEVKTQVSTFEEIREWITTYPFELIYVLVLLISIIITIFAFFHAKSAYCCYDKCVIGYADDAKYICALLFGLQFWDFMSDISFAYNLPNKSENAIFYLSVIFIVVPWFINIVFLLLYRYNWANNAAVSNWLREHTVKLVFATMICGGAQTSVELMNSRIFGLAFFEMGLSRMQLIETGKFKVMLTTVLENIPQIFCTTYWMTQTEYNDFAVASLISSTCSVILVVVATILIRMDNLHDEQIEFVLHYKWIKQKNDPKIKHDSTEELKRIGLHHQISKCIANTLELNPTMVYIDKHVIGAQTLTLNVSITHAFSEQQSEMQPISQKEPNNEDMKDDDDDVGNIDGFDGIEDEEYEDEENIISKQSVIYKLKGCECEQIMNDILNILCIDKDNMRISRIDVIPLDYNGAKLSLHKTTTFDEHQLRRMQTEWTFHGKSNILQSNMKDDGGRTHDNTEQKDIQHETKENMLLLLDD